MHQALRARAVLAIFALLLVAGCFLDPPTEESTVPPGDTNPPPPLASPGLLEDITELGSLYTPVDNWWNLDVAKAPVDPNSASIIATIKNYESTGGRLHPEFTPSHGIPYAVVDATTPLVAVTFANTEESDKGAPGQPAGYPIPTAANANTRYLEDAGTSGSNRRLLLLDRDRRLAFELSYAQYSGGKWSAGYGAVFKLDSNYRRPEGWTSTDAAGLCVLSGLARYDEAYGPDPIRHALRCSLQKTNGHVWPASHTGASDAGAPPLGTRFRLKASFDLSDYPAPMQKVLQAMKTYGLIVASRGGNMYVQGTMDTRWDNETLDPAFHSLHVDDFDVIKLGWDGTTPPPPPPPPTSPAAPTLSSPANGASGVVVPASLTWNASSGATSYTAQVSSSSGFSTFAYNVSGITSTSRSVSGLSSNTVYYWRVSATNTGGTSSFSATSSFTTEDVTPPPPPPPPPAVPTLSAPANGATGVVVPASLTWNASSGATSYTAQVSSSSSFSTFAYNASGITLTSRSVSGLSENTVYYWRVSATNAGGTSSYSATSSFTTEDVTPPPPPPAPPAAPTLSSPANGATGVAVPVSLAWNASSGATSYTAQVSSSSSFSTLAYNQSGITSTSRSVSGLSSNTVYYWRVSATNAGGTSSYSATSSFTTEDVTPPPPPPPTPPAVPTLSAPANGATGVVVPVTLAWNASSGATSYTAQVSSSSSFSTFAYNVSGITSTSRSVSGLSSNTVYYWRVSATNAGGTSSFSATSSFTTEDVTPPPPPPPAPPAAPTLSAPANGASGVAVPVTLTWNASSGATSYTAQVSSSSSFSTFAYNVSGITSTSRSVSGLSENTVYYWRVSATNAGGTSSFSATSSFTTEDVTPPPPPPPPPPPGQVGLGLLADLTPLGTLYAPDDNWWNLDISAAPLAPNSAQIIATIQTYESTQGRMHPDFAPNFGIPYCVVDDTTPLVPVSLGNTSESDKGYPGAPTGYPIPAAAMTSSRYFENGATAGNANGGDSHLLIYNRDKRAVFELSYCSYSGGKWSAGYGAVFKVDSNYRRPEGWTSTDAAGLCVLAGLVRYDEVYGNAPILHATRTSIKKVNGYVWPASHTGSTDPNGFPCGMRFRLKKSFDTSGYPAPLRKLFESWKVYGLILSDRGGNMYIQGTMDSRWDNGVLNPAFHSLHASDFDVIQLGWKP